MAINLLLVIVDNMEACPILLKRWQEIGVPGTTILRSLGGYKTTSWLERVGLGMLGRAFDSDEIRQRTLLSVIEDEDLLEKAIAEAEHVVGGFEESGTGILFVLPVVRALGLKKRRRPTPEEIVSSAPAPQPISELDHMRSVPVSEVLAVHKIQPAIITRDDTLNEVARKMLMHPSAQVACIVNEENRLSGLVRLESVVNDLFIHLMPEEYFQDMSKLDAALDYAAKLKHRTAADCAEEPVYVYPDDTVRTAFQRMHDANLPGMPVIDDAHHVIGYINMLEMLALVARSPRLAEAEDSLP
jgi:CBS domain-containing protein